MSGNSTDRAERRVNPRYPVMWSGELRAVSSFDWYILDCRIRNVSISGVHVLVDRSIEPGRAVVLRIANVGDFTGQVAWSEGDRLGICFDEASDRLAELIRKEPPAEPMKADRLAGEFAPSELGGCPLRPTAGFSSDAGADRISSARVDDSDGELTSGKDMLYDRT